MLKKRKLALLLLVGLVYISSLNEFIMAALFPGADRQYEHVGFSPEFFLGLLFIFISLIFLTRAVVFQPLSGKASTTTVILLLTFLLMSVGACYHARDLDGVRILLALGSMFLYFFIGKGLALAYGEYLAGRLWRYLAPLPIFFLLFYLFFLMSGRIEYADIFTIDHFMPGRWMVEGLKPQIEGGLRSDEIATYVGSAVIFLLYCLHATDNKRNRKFLFLMLGLAIAALIAMLSMGAYLAIGAAFGLYMIQKRGAKGLTKLLSICLLAGLACGLFFPSALMVLKEKVIEKSIDVSSDIGSHRGIRYALLLATAVKNPVFGVGPMGVSDLVPTGMKMRHVGSAPHQNILGIAAGYGIAAAIFYTLFIFSIIWSGTNALCKWDTARSPGSEKMRYLLFMATACFLFLQIHGLFMDTWQIKQTYLWAGITAGLVQRLQLNYGKQAIQRSFNVTLGKPSACPL